MPECCLDCNWPKQWSVSGCETPFMTLRCFSLCRKCCRRRGKTSQARRWRSTSASLTPAPSWWRSVCCRLGHWTAWNLRHFPMQFVPALRLRCSIEWIALWERLLCTAAVNCKEMKFKKHVVLLYFTGRLHDLSVLMAGVPCQWHSYGWCAMPRAFLWLVWPCWWHSYGLRGHVKGILMTGVVMPRAFLWLVWSCWEHAESILVAGVDMLRAFLWLVWPCQEHSCVWRGHAESILLAGVVMLRAFLWLVWSCQEHSYGWCAMPRAFLWLVWSCFLVSLMMS